MEQERTPDDESETTTEPSAETPTEATSPPTVAEDEQARDTPEPA